jgi:2'-5' RNA ligase
MTSRKPSSRLSGDQAGFDFGPYPQRLQPTRRQFSGSTLFVAILPDIVTSRRVRRIAQSISRRHHLSGNLRPLSTLHVSLVNIDHYRSLPEDIVFSAAEALCGVDASPVDIIFDQMMSFGHRDAKPLVLCGSQPNAALSALYKEVVAALFRAGVSFSLPPNFEPHMTVMWDCAMVDRQGLDPPLLWTAREICLIHSLVGKTEYEYLGRWPLLRAPRPD